MILVDSSVWIGYFNGARTPETNALDALLGHEELAIGDLILTEVLQGFRQDHEYAIALRMLTSLRVLELGGRELAIQAARNFRTLRKTGITIRKTVDTLIATRCIESNHELLYEDRDFDPFVKHLGLRRANLNGTP